MSTTLCHRDRTHFWASKYIRCCMLKDYLYQQFQISDVICFDVALFAQSVGCKLQEAYIFLKLL
uniref:Uncharacterized protein n=1 Tax=Setaria italica TaxID=4555 RepID=K3ZBL3_SETIT